MKRFLRYLVFLVVVVGAGLAVWHYEGEPDTSHDQAQSQGRGGGRRGGRNARPEGPTSVTTTASRVADVPVTLDAVGTAQALNSVTVKPQVDGRLIELDFREGQDVKEGDVLARIDPTIYQAQYEQALAKKAQDEATLANARIDLTRYQNLAKTNYGSKQQADTQAAMVAQLEAQIKADQGAIDNAKAYVDYTTIRAPIDGRTGIRMIDAGNLVQAASSTGIVIITQLNPISVVFNLPQQNLRVVNAAQAAGRLPVEALESDNRTAIDRGVLKVVDNQVDQTTGTVKIKATFPNDHLQLWPGSFVNVRLTIDTLKNAVVVPTGAVQRGPNGAFVYGVADDKAVLKPVTVAQQTEEVSVIASGLKPPERVITTGFARLTDGDRVRVVEPGTAEAAAASGSAEGLAAEPSAGAGGSTGRPRRPDAAGADTPTSATGNAPAGERHRRRPADAGAPPAGGADAGVAAGSTNDTSPGERHGRRRGGQPPPAGGPPPASGSTP